MRVKSEEEFWGVVVNRKTTEMMGCKDPAEAINQKILISGNDATVVGVIEDFNLYSLHNPMMATAFYHEPKRFVNAIVQYADNQESKVIQLAESNWRRYFPDTYFSAHTYKDELSDYYESDARTLGLVKFFSVIAILIGCMGLFGLVSFMVVQRTKEIGIRKVLGASVSTITNMLLQTFIIWIGIANLVAWPLAWYAMNRWLQNFAYHIEVEFWVFGVAAIASLSVGALTVAWHAVRAALTDPVEAIRYE
jgi:putative ABC transport system permease protein